MVSQPSRPFVTVQRVCQDAIVFPRMLQATVCDVVTARIRYEPFVRNVSQPSSAARRRRWCCKFFPRGVIRLVYAVNARFQSGSPAELYIAGVSKQQLFSTSGRGR